MPWLSAALDEMSALRPVVRRAPCGAWHRLLGVSHTHPPVGCTVLQVRFSHWWCRAGSKGIPRAACDGAAGQGCARPGGGAAVAGGSAQLRVL
jgi:hypothetical protein